MADFVIVVAALAGIASANPAAPVVPNNAPTVGFKTYATVDACEDAVAHLKRPARHPAGLPAGGDPGGRAGERLLKVKQGRGEGILPGTPHLFLGVGICRAANARPTKSKGGVGRCVQREEMLFPPQPCYSTTIRGPAAPPAPCQLLPQPCGDAAIGLRLLGFRPGGDDRRAGIRQHPDVQLQRQLAEELDAHPRRLRPRPAMAEDVRPVAAVRAAVEGHVLDQPEHRHVDLLEHLHPAPRVDQRHVLRRARR